MEKKGFNSASTDDDHNNSNCTGLTAGPCECAGFVIIIGWLLFSMSGGKFKLKR